MTLIRWESHFESLQSLDMSGDIPFLPALSRVREDLPAHLQDLRAAGEFIIRPVGDTEELTEQTIALLRRWHLQPNPPSLTALCIYTMEAFNLKCDPALIKAVLAASVLGAVENNLPYHNNLHYRKVLLQVMRMIAVHNEIYEDTPKALNDEQIALLLIAACIHDLGHDGQGNTVKGVFHPGRLEKRSFDLAEPYFKAVGFDDAEKLNSIRVMVLCTEVTPLGDPANPVSQMKAAYRYHFLGQKSRIQSLNLDRDLEALEFDSKLTTMSLILHEADVATSAGLDYEVTKHETSILCQEIGEPNATPQHVLDFMSQICQRQMLSSAGQELYAANMARIQALAEEDARSGNHAFPPAEYSGFLRGYQDGDSKTIN